MEIIKVDTFNNLVIVKYRNEYYKRNVSTYVDKFYKHDTIYWYGIDIDEYNENGISAYGILDIETETKLEQEYKRAIKLTNRMKKLNILNNE